MAYMINCARGDIKGANLIEIPGLELLLACYVIPTVT